MSEFAWPIIIALTAVLVLFLYSRWNYSFSSITINGKQLPWPIKFLISSVGIFLALMIVFFVFTIIGMVLLGLPVFLLVLFSLILVAIIGFVLLLPVLILSLIAYGVGRSFFSKIN